MAKAKRRSGEGSRIAVAMSGGVDSSVAAALLKRAGHDVVGMTFRTWPKEECGASLGKACCSLEAITRARVVAEALGAPYYVFDLSHEFKEKVIDYFCAEYIKGHTPNPCVVCNERIKFASLLEKARSLGIYRIATGHYARIEFNKARKRFLLKCAKDGTKDQSYFLFSLSQQQLGSALFPLGGYTKVAVRRAAKRFRLKTYNTPSSQDICFTQGLNYGEYIREKAGMEMKGGDIVHEDGRILGRHKGIPFYTLGQRKGLSVAYKEPLYVTAIDAAKNRVIVGTKRHILRKSLIADRLNWITQDGISRPMKVLAKIRYNHKKAKAVVSREGSGSVRVDFEKPQASPTPGQAVVFYDKDIVIGGGWIRDCPR